MSVQPEPVEQGRPPAKNRSAAPPEYNADVHPLLVKWNVQRGDTVRGLAKRLGLPAALLEQWLVEHPELAAAREEGLGLLDARVMEALYQRAVGGEIEITEVVADGDKRRLKKIRRQYPADPRSAIYILKNRRPEQWRDKPPPAEPEERLILTYPTSRPRPHAENESP